MNDARVDPTRPTSVPSASTFAISSTMAKIAAKIGVPPLSRPATAELMRCSAIGSSVNWSSATAVGGGVVDDGMAEGTWAG